MGVLQQHVFLPHQFPHTTTTVCGSAGAVGGKLMAMTPGEKVHPGEGSRACSPVNSVVLPLRRAVVYHCTPPLL